MKLKSYRERFSAMTFKVNAMALAVFIFMLLGYFTMSFGETDFLRRLTEAHKAYQQHHPGEYYKQFLQEEEEGAMGGEGGGDVVRNERGAKAALSAAARALLSNDEHHPMKNQPGPPQSQEAPEIADVKMQAAAAASAAGIPLVGSLSVNSSAYLYFDDDSVWSEEYADLVAITPTAVLLMMLILPMAVQASALFAENAAVPVLVMETMKVSL